MATRTITLTGRPPVQINEDNWPLIAQASDKTFDNQYEFQANCISKWFVGVRQSDNGAALVYATYSYDTNWQHGRSYAAKRGERLAAGATSDDICRAIERVTADIAQAECAGDDSARWPTLCAECIADMPAEVLDEETEDAE